MPITTNKTASAKKDNGENLGSYNVGSRWMYGNNTFTYKMLSVLSVIFLLYGIVFVGTLINNNLKQYNYIGKAAKMERTIAVNGYGKVSGNNDIAVTTIGYSNTDKDVAKAQADNKKVMDQITSDLKKMGVEDKDLQNNYTIYPNYNYTPQKGQELIGYQVSNQLTIKIRDLTKIPNILSLAGKYGATEVSGLNFTIDDPENLKADARAKALIDARTKAADLADKLGVRVGSVVSYNEFEDNTGGPIYNMKALDSAQSVGGGPATVSSGSRDVVMNVSVTYEILP
ncbi:MAG: SIMPL domain-containing protein [Candidatus Magasanikbacteria bacterium]|nr:SIMPL domain-containing protein [Candidatus Magasanikbacteria bacterium]